MKPIDFYNDYEMPLAHALNRIERRGIIVDQERLTALRSELELEIRKELDEIATEVGRTVCLAAKDAPDKNTLVLQSQPQLVKFLEEERHIVVPTSRLTSKATTSADALYRLLAETGDPVLHSILQIREMGKIKSTNVEAALYKNILYSSYRATGTNTGRRASNESFVDLGCNGQNIPKHSKWGMKYRSCLIARPGKIFLQCDQKTAEDWVIHAIIADVSGIENGINELRSGINRHKKLGGFIFSKPEHEIDKAGIEYYLAKKTRYAGSYGMGRFTMSESLAKEGHVIKPEECDAMLSRFHLAEPAIRDVFQRWVEDQIRLKRRLDTPLGRRRHFFGVRPYSDNHEIFRQGYAQIPQSSVGDNTGMAIVFLEITNEQNNQWRQLLAEGHDSIIEEVDDNDLAVIAAAHEMQQAFDRKLRFLVNGYEITIPIDIELGYDLGGMVTCQDFSSGVGLRNTLSECKMLQRKRQENSISGLLLHS